MSIEPIQIKNQPAKDTPPELCIRSIATNMFVLRRNELSKGNEREKSKKQQRFRFVQIVQWKLRHLVVWKTKLNRKPLQYWTQIPNQIQRQSLWFYGTIEWVRLLFALFFIRSSCVYISIWLPFSLHQTQVHTLCCCCKSMFVRMAVRVRQVAHTM